MKPELRQSDLLTIKRRHAHKGDMPKEEIAATGLAAKSMAATGKVQAKKYRSRTHGSAGDGGIRPLDRGGLPDQP